METQTSVAVSTMPPTQVPETEGISAKSEVLRSAVSTHHLVTSFQVREGKRPNTRNKQEPSAVS